MNIYRLNCVATLRKPVRFRFGVRGSGSNGLSSVADISDDITGVLPVAASAQDTTPDLTFTGAVAAASSRIGFAANSGGCGSPSYVFTYATAPATIAAIDTKDTYVVCYSIDGGLTYTEQTTFGDAFVVEGSYGACLCQCAHASI
jgi:hypothetical protein